MSRKSIGRAIASVTATLRQMSNGLSPRDYEFYWRAQGPDTLGFDGPEGTRVIRKRVLDRNNWRCQNCGASQNFITSSRAGNWMRQLRKSDHGMRRLSRYSSRQLQGATN